ncbi:hypothetical protein ACFLY7_01725 [Patescibacteria group bacterium]
MAIFIVMSVFSFNYLAGVWDSVDAMESDLKAGDWSGEAWSQNIGWISFSGGSGDTVYEVEELSLSSFMSGYAWNDNIGWISFEPADLEDCPSRVGGGNNDSCSLRIEENGSLRGWARALASDDVEAGGWDGWISFDCETAGSCVTGVDYGVVWDEGWEQFRGFAWGGDVIGWISFNCHDDGACSRDENGDIEDNIADSDYMVTRYATVPSVTLTASHENIDEPTDSLVLTWSIVNLNRDNCVINTGVSDGYFEDFQSDSGTLQIESIEDTTTYTLVCSEEGVGYSDSVTVEYTEPKVIFGASETSVGTGVGFLLNWEFSNIDTEYCFISSIPEISDFVPENSELVDVDFGINSNGSGSLYIDSISTDTTYSLGCDSVSSPVLVSVVYNPDEISLSLIADDIDVDTEGQIVKLLWTFSNIDMSECDTFSEPVDESWIDLPSDYFGNNSIFEVGPIIEDIIYTLDCGLEEGSEDFVEIKYSYVESSLTLTANPTLINLNPNRIIELTWDFKNINTSSCEASSIPVDSIWNSSLDFSSYSSDSTDSLEVGSITEDTIYTLTCGTATNTATVDYGYIYFDLDPTSLGRLESPVSEKGKSASLVWDIPVGVTCVAYTLDTDFYGLEDDSTWFGEKTSQSSSGGWETGPINLNPTTYYLDCDDDLIIHTSSSDISVDVWYQEPAIELVGVTPIPGVAVSGSTEPQVSFGILSVGDQVSEVVEIVVEALGGFDEDVIIEILPVSSCGLGDLSAEFSGGESSITLGEGEYLDGLNLDVNLIDATGGLGSCEVEVKVYGGVGVSYREDIMIITIGVEPVTPTYEEV